MRSGRFRIGVVILLLAFSSRQALAEDLTMGLSLSKDLPMARGSGSEYMSGDYPGAVLMRVNLWGAVGKSGIHFIPTQTDLITLLSYAGGPTPNAVLDGVLIKRWARGKQYVIHVDAEELIGKAGKESPILQANDIVVVPTKAPLISQDTASIISLVTSLVSLIAVGAVFLKK